MRPSETVSNKIYIDIGNKIIGTYSNDLTLFQLGKDTLYHRDSISRDKANSWNILSSKKLKVPY